LLDLHSFHTAASLCHAGPQDNSGTLEPFARSAEETAGVRLGVHRFVDGWLDTYAAGVARRLAAGVGTRSRRALRRRTTEYMRAQAASRSPSSAASRRSRRARRGYRAIHNALAQLRLTSAPVRQP